MKGKMKKQEQEEEGSDEDFDVGDEEGEKNDRISIPVSQFQTKFIPEKEEQSGRPQEDPKSKILNLEEKGI